MCTTNPQVKNIIVSGCFSLSFSFWFEHICSPFSLALLIFPLFFSWIWQYLLMGRLKSRERAHSVIPRQWPTGLGGFGWNWVIAYRSQACDKTIWMIRHRKWSWHSDRVRVGRWNPLEAHYSVVFVLICLTKKGLNGLFSLGLTNQRWRRGWERWRRLSVIVWL